MWATKQRYDAFAYRRETPEPRFEKDVPDWPLLDRLSQNWAARVTWLAAYTGFYFVFANHWYLWLLLPAHFVMGPIHGAIVNWCGHRYGYRNFDSDDGSTTSVGTQGAASVPPPSPSPSPRASSALDASEHAPPSQLSARSERCWSLR